MKEKLTEEFREAIDRWTLRFRSPSSETSYISRRLDTATKSYACKLTLVVYTIVLLLQTLCFMSQADNSIFPALNTKPTIISLGIIWAVSIIFEVLAYFFFHTLRAIAAMVASFFLIFHFGQSYYGFPAGVLHWYKPACLARAR
ncbi:MAG: hypothetical protein P4M11_03415 [Candidatus Pacebacteria bacterium]|nr:hypothetical protein [Candidatus Paceibacterota bacterium]